MKPQYEDENLKNQLNLNFLSNKIKGVQSSKKQLTLLNFLNNKIGLKSINFLQETHSSIEAEKNGLIILIANSCGILIAIYSNMNICLYI